MSMTGAKRTYDEMAAELDASEARCNYWYNAAKRLLDHCVKLTEARDAD